MLWGKEAEPEQGDSNDKPRCSGRVKEPTKVIESQLRQIDNGLILTAAGARAKTISLNARRKRNTKTLRLVDRFELVRYDLSYYMNLRFSTI